MEMYTIETEMIINNYDCEQWQSNKMDNLGKMDRFLKAYNLLKLIHEMEILNWPIMSKEIESIIINFPIKKIKIKMSSLVKSTNFIMKN
jgi:hypothetical protein